MLNHVNEKKLSFSKLIELLAENPCKIYKIKNKGFIKIGYDADFTIVDLNKEVKIDNGDMASKCGWSPFSWNESKGTAVATIINGEIKMMNGKIIDKPNGKAVNFE